jgi:hypothetical protein
MPKKKAAAPEIAPDVFEVVDIRRHHGDYDVITCENVAIEARKGPLGKAQQLKFWAAKAYLEVGDKVSLGKV